MITKEHIEDQIKQLRTEQAQLQTRHDRMVIERNERETQFSQVVIANQNRFQQITGAMSKLVELLNQFNGENPVK